MGKKVFRIFYYKKRLGKMSCKIPLSWTSREGNFFEVFFLYIRVESWGMSMIYVSAL